MNKQIIWEIPRTEESTVFTYSSKTTMTKSRTFNPSLPNPIIKRQKRGSLWSQRAPAGEILSCCRCRSRCCPQSSAPRSSPSGPGWLCAQRPPAPGSRCTWRRQPKTNTLSEELVWLRKNPTSLAKIFLIPTVPGSDSEWQIHQVRKWCG